MPATDGLRTSPSLFYQPCSCWLFSRASTIPRRARNCQEVRRLDPVLPQLWSQALEWWGRWRSEANSCGLCRTRWKVNPNNPNPTDQGALQSTPKSKGWKDESKGRWKVICRLYSPYFSSTVLLNHSITALQLAYEKDYITHASTFQHHGMSFIYCFLDPEQRKESSPCVQAYLQSHSHQLSS